MVAEAETKFIHSNHSSSNEYKPSFLKLYKYANTLDKAFIVIGCSCALVLGVLIPASALLFRGIVNSFVNVASPNAQYLLIAWYALLALFVFILSMGKSLTLYMSSVRQAERIRALYYKAIMHQGISWFDQIAVGELMNNLSSNTDSIQLGIGIKLGDFIQNMTGFLVGLVIGLVVKWKLAVVACAALPFIVISFSAYGVIARIFFAKEEQAFSRANSISNEALSCIKTVVSYCGESVETKKYEKELRAGELVEVKRSTAYGGISGLVGLSIFLSAALVFWYGVNLIVVENVTPGDIITVFVSILLGSIFLGNALPTFPVFMKAVVASNQIYGVIDRPNFSDQPKKQDFMDLKANISFHNVTFSYPTRSDVPVLTNFNLDLCYGQTVAIVGPSGSGKSTIVHLLQRFYDPTGGNIMIEDVDLRDINLSDYRQQIGCVQQEPVLFSGTIRDNIRMGKLDATESEIRMAAESADANAFIETLPQKYDTLIGESGYGLSGGQKQRIAIARTLIRNPKLMLFDEATSALDSKSEYAVQTTMKKASQGRTVIIITHHLPAIRDADQIIVLDAGQIKEFGTHENLLEQDGLYAAMLRQQERSMNIETSNEDQALNGAGIQFMQAVDNPNQMDVDYADVLSGSDENVAVKIVDIPITERYLFLKLLHLNKPEHSYLLVGCFCAVLSGSAQPLFAIFYSQLYEIFTLNKILMVHKVNQLSAILAVLALINFFVELVQGYLLGVTGARLAVRLRTNLFEAILKQEIAWHDRPENQPSVLSNCLISDTTKVAGICGTSLISIIQTFVLCAFSLVVGFVYSWQLTLVIFPLWPLLIFSSWMNAKRTSSLADIKETEALKVAKESISAKRTVASLALEDYFIERYEKFCLSDIKTQLIYALKNGLVHSLAETAPIINICTCFALGIHLVSRKVINMLALFRVFIMFSMSSQSLGRVTTYIMGLQPALRSARKIFQIIDDHSFNLLSCPGDEPEEKFTGSIEFKHVNFRYPTRPNFPVIQNFSHLIKPHSSVGLVGSSGCGKSTLLQLVLRFYNPVCRRSDHGIFFDGMNIRNLSPYWIRKQVGFVSQEPVLFNRTLMENIAYGDNSRIVTIEDVMEVAKLADIHEFIMSLPKGYNTLAGEGGSQLSGGQKQRIAIARALIGQPVLLMLDEATSALDSENEKLVQEALDRAAQSRTALVVAHRLVTVDKCDEIVVMANGHKIESGEPSHLLQLKAAFYDLNKLQCN